MLSIWEGVDFLHSALHFYRQVGCCQSAAYISSALIFNINKYTQSSSLLSKSNYEVQDVSLRSVN